MKRLSRFHAATNQPFSATNLRARCAPNRYPASVRQEQGNGGRISGPSFLGLNSQPENNSDVEYLLEDQPTGGGLRKVLLLVVLAAILGLLFMQWRSSFKASPKPPTPAKSDPSTPANRRRETINLLIQWDPLLRTRLKPQPVEPMRYYRQFDARLLSYPGF